MNSELEKILNSKTDLNDYLKEYGENSLFLYNYYLQNIKRVLDNFYAYGGYLSISDKISLINELLKQDPINYEILNFLLNNLDNYYADDKHHDDIELLYNNIFNLSKEKKINLKLLNIRSRIYSIDPLYILNEDFNAINDIFISDSEMLIKILDLSVSKNYRFTGKDSSFIEYFVLDDLDVLVHFINNCKYDDFIAGVIYSYFDSLDKEVLHDIYERINNDESKDFLANTLNFDTFDTNLIVDGKDVFLFVDNNEDKGLETLKGLKDRGFNNDVIIVVNRVDLDYIDKAYSLMGDHVKISPLMSQEHKKDFEETWDYPYYSVDHIKESEKNLDLYVKTTMDKVDKDGDIKSLSPFEKFIAAYILTQKFYPYTEEDDEYHEYHTSRSIYELIDKINNRRIVCVGFVHLLQEFLYRMGLKDTIRWDVYSVDADKENDGRRLNNHARMIIHLVDPKYNLDGIYMSDPTWDESATWGKTEPYVIKTNHMLMSRNEIRMVDPKFTDRDLHLDETDKIGEAFNINNVDELFNKPISKDTYIKGFLAVEHFLDKNMKMTDTYDNLEYQEMAIKLGFIDKHDLDMAPSYLELLQMKREELEYYFDIFPDLKLDFLTNVRIDLRSRFEEEGIKFPIRIMSKGIGVDIDINDPAIKILEDSGYKLMYGKKKAYIDVYTYTNKPMIDQFDKIVDTLLDYKRIVDSVSLVNNNSGVK